MLFPSTCWLKQFSLRGYFIYRIYLLVVAFREALIRALYPELCLINCPFQIVKYWGKNVPFPSEHDVNCSKGLIFLLSFKNAISSCC